MSPFEYIIPFVSVLVGLAVADIVTSLHRLLRARHRVQWDWLPLIAALLVILNIVNIWWGFYRAQDMVYYQTFAGFLPVLAKLVLVFLLTASALPDKVPTEGIDLKNFYDENSSYFWSLFATYIFALVAHSVGRQLMAGQDVIAVLVSSVDNLILIALYVCLAFFHNRIFHAVVAIASLVVYIISWSSMSLGAV